MDTFSPRLDILPTAQRQLLPELRPVQQLGFVLYGGTAIALRLGHRQSLDFDFSSSRPVDRVALRQALPFLRATTVRQDRRNTFEVATASGVIVSFFGGLDFGRAGQPKQTDDGVLRVASLTDLMATKLKVILQRSEAKDYQNLAAMVRAGTTSTTPRRIPRGSTKSNAGSISSPRVPSAAAPFATSRNSSSGSRLTSNTTTAIPVLSNGPPPPTRSSARSSDIKKLSAGHNTSQRLNYRLTN